MSGEWENSKYEAQNSKQIQITKIQNFETGLGKEDVGKVRKNNEIRTIFIGEYRLKVVVTMV